MSAKSIEDFKSALSYGGIRPTMYEVSFSLPESLVNNTDAQVSDIRTFTMLAKAAQVPGEILTTVTVGLPAGGALKLPGSRIYDPWTCTLITDGHMRLRTLFELWGDRIISRNASLRELDETAYLSEVDIVQLDRMSNPLRKYTLHYAYPTSIAPMQLSYDAVDMISEYTLQWNYHYYTAQSANEDGTFTAESNLT